MADLETRMDAALAPKWAIDQCSMELGHHRRILVWSEPGKFAWRVWVPGLHAGPQRMGHSDTLGRAKNDAMSAAKSLGWL